MAKLNAALAQKIIGQMGWWYGSKVVLVLAGVKPAATVELRMRDIILLLRVKLHIAWTGGRIWDVAQNQASLMYLHNARSHVACGLAYGYPECCVFAYQEWVESGVERHPFWAQGGYVEQGRWTHVPCSPSCKETKALHEKEAEVFLQLGIGQYIGVMLLEGDA